MNSEDMQAQQAAEMEAQKRRTIVGVLFRQKEELSWSGVISVVAIFFVDLLTVTVGPGVGAVVYTLVVEMAFKLLASGPTIGALKRRAVELVAIRQAKIADDGSAILEGPLEDSVPRSQSTFTIESILSKLPMIINVRLFQN